MLVLVFRMLRYCRMSGNVIRRRALRNLRPIQVLSGRTLLFDRSRIKNLCVVRENKERAVQSRVVYQAAGVLPVQVNGDK